MPRFRQPPANSNGALPDCPVCHVPGLPGRVAGVRCLTPSGRLRPPHKARLREATLVAADVALVALQNEARR